MANILLAKRGTRAQLNAAATANGLHAGEPYLITDEGRLAVGLAVGSYAELVGTTAAQALSGKTLTGLKETKTASSGYNFDLAAGNYFTHTASANNLTVSNVPATGSVGAFIVELTNGGAYTFAFWSGVKWAGGAVPALTAAGVDILGFYTHDGGTTWRGLLLAKDSK
ncbi:MAG: hypothetical protein KAX51_08600 [Chromatiaceae bacterium]|nr:hypothetical protein [Chromatiaceae bacterium]MBP8289846.1 hypothetical protein [Chromatiaceae bacterium]